MGALSRFWGELCNDAGSSTMLMWSPSNGKFFLITDWFWISWQWSALSPRSRRYSKASAKMLQRSWGFREHRGSSTKALVEVSLVQAINYFPNHFVFEPNICMKSIHEVPRNSSSKNIRSFSPIFQGLSLSKAWNFNLRSPLKPFCEAFRKLKFPETQTQP